MLSLGKCPRAKKTLNPSGAELPRTGLSPTQPIADSTAPNLARFVSIQGSCHDANFEPLLYLNAGHIRFSSVRVHFSLLNYVYSNK